MSHLRGVCLSLSTVVLSIQVKSEVGIWYRKEKNKKMDGWMLLW